MRGLILYGPPAAGKDTVTAALTRRARHYMIVPKVKVGGGNTSGYRMVTHSELLRLRRAGRIVQENMRYGNIYAVDRALVGDVRHHGGVPVLHAGRVDDLRAMGRSLPGSWTAVVLWCSRETAERRSVARRDADTVDRLKVWDETLDDRSGIGSDEISLWIDTDRVAPDHAAALIDHLMATRVSSSSASGRDLDGSGTAGLAGGPGLVVPVVTPIDATGRVDDDAVLRYAERFVAWHPSAVPLVAGSYGRGDRLPRAQRRLLARLWSDVLGVRPVAVAVYDVAEAGEVIGLGRWPLFVPPVGSTARSVRTQLGDLTSRLWVYSRPGRLVLGPGEAARLAARGFKLAKCGLERLAAVRAAVGSQCDLWHATARDPVGSRAHGANSLVAACLADLPSPAPTPGSLAGIDRVARPALARLDAEGDRSRRVTALERSVRARCAAG